MPDLTLSSRGTANRVALGKAIVINPQRLPHRAEIGLIGKPSDHLNVGRKTPVPWFVVNARRIVPGIAEVEIEFSSVAT